VIADILQHENAALVCLVHDLIPMEFPEYARRGQPEVHARRMDSVVRMADAIIVNSEATRQSLQPHLAAVWRNPPVLVAHLGVEPEQDNGQPVVSDATPYFVCIGTIEPRKNHLLLMHLWRRMAADPNAPPPRLILIGRRGWENENVVDMLERCAALKGIVQERNEMSDHDVHVLLRGARALLLPSFAEGYGLPVAEALALGVPVICSDLPALREVGRDAADYLDPLDGPSWARAIWDYVPANSPRRAAQIERLKSWQAPNWNEHMRDVLNLLDGLKI
jgi:glycosyltransferase involved in cell wall biosynthesis